MELIIQWITQIIIFLLLANIIELLIPKTAMKKYIKLVIGLILLLIFLKPVFYIFTIDIKSEIENAIVSGYQADEELNSIENSTEIQIREIQASQDAYILEQLTNQLKELARETLLAQFEVEIDDISYLFNTVENVNYENLTELVVTIRTQTELEGVIRSVEEISILEDDPMNDEMIMHLDLVDIEKTLREVWEMGDVKLIVKWRGGPS